MYKLIPAIFSIGLLSSCFTILSMGQPVTEVNLRSETGPVRVEALQSGQPAGSCELPCTLPLRTAQGYVLYFSSPGANSESVLLRMDSSASLARGILYNIPTLFIGSVVDVYTGAGFVVTPTRIVVRKANGRLEAFADAAAPAQ